MLLKGQCTQTTKILSSFARPRVVLKPGVRRYFKKCRSAFCPSIWTSGPLTFIIWTKTVQNYLLLKNDSLVGLERHEGG